jgi:hypothetical protein
MNDDQRKAMFARFSSMQGSRQSRGSPFTQTNPYQPKVNTTIEVIEFTDSPSVKQAKEQRVKRFVDEINQYSEVPIKSKFYRYLSEVITPNQHKSFMRHLTLDKSGQRFFLASERLDDSQTQVYMEIDFLIESRGNEYVPQKTQALRRLMPTTKVDPPLFNAKTGKVEEGNHRIKVAKELGATSVPVMVFWK